MFFGFFGISVPLHRRENNSIKKKSQMLKLTVSDRWNVFQDPSLLLLHFISLDDGNDHSFNQFVLGWSHTYRFFNFFFFLTFWWNYYYARGIISSECMSCDVHIWIEVTVDSRQCEKHVFHFWKFHFYGFILFFSSLPEHHHRGCSIEKVWNLFPHIASFFTFPVFNFDLTP